MKFVSTNLLKQFALGAICISLSLSCYKSVLLQPDQTIDMYFQCWENKNINGINKLLTSRHKIPNRMWEFEKIKYVKLLSKSDCTESKKDLYLNYGNGKIKKPFDISIYCVKFEFRYKDGQCGAMNNGIHEWNFTIIKEGNDSEWLIDDWGY